MTPDAPSVTDWIGAISGIIAAVGGVGTLIIAIVLISKQHTSLTKTIELAEKQAEVLDGTLHSLEDEKAFRAEERARQREEAEERRKEQARRVGLLPLVPPLAIAHQSIIAITSSKGRDADLVEAFLRSSGLKITDIKHAFEVANSSDSRITGIRVLQENGQGPRCYVAGFEQFARVSPLSVLPPGESVRFYWAEPVSDIQVYVDFTDAAGVRWRLHHRDGLSEITGEE